MQMPQCRTLGSAGEDVLRNLRASAASSGVPARARMLLAPPGMPSPSSAPGSAACAAAAAAGPGLGFPGLTAAAALPAPAAVADSPAARPTPVPARLGGTRGPRGMPGRMVTRGRARWRLEKRAPPRVRGPASPAARCP